MHKSVTLKAYIVPTAVLLSIILIIANSALFLLIPPSGTNEVILVIIWEICVNAFIIAIMVSVLVFRRPIYILDKHGFEVVLRHKSDKTVVVWDDIIKFEPLYVAGMIYEGLNIVYKTGIKNDISALCVSMKDVKLVLNTFPELKLLFANIV